MNQWNALVGPLIEFTKQGRLTGTGQTVNQRSAVRRAYFFLYSLKVFLASLERDRFMVNSLLVCVQQLLKLVLRILHFMTALVEHDLLIEYLGKETDQAVESCQRLTVPLAVVFIDVIATEGLFATRDNLLFEGCQLTARLIVWVAVLSSSVIVHLGIDGWLAETEKAAAEQVGVHQSAKENLQFRHTLLLMRLSTDIVAFLVRHLAQHHLPTFLRGNPPVAVAQQTDEERT